MKVRSKLLSVFMSIVLVAGLTPGAAFAYSAGSTPPNTPLSASTLTVQDGSTASGKWGDLDWTLSEDGKLVISGNGKMDDFEYGSNDAWHQGNLEDSITSVTIMSGVTSVSYYAFGDCRYLTSVEIPEGVTDIAFNAFYYCESLTSLTLPSSVSSVTPEAFFGCGKLAEVKVAEGKDAAYHSDSSGALYHGTQLVYYPEGATAERFDIEPGTVSCFDCIVTNDSLTTLGIPASVEEFDVFRVMAPALTAFEVAAENPIYYADDAGVLYKDNKDGEDDEGGLTLVAYPQGKEEETYTVKEGTVRIGDDAFSAYGAESGTAYHLKSIDLGSSVEYIGQNCFCDCFSLEKITIPAACKEVSGGSTFRGCLNLTAFEVQEGNEVYYSDSNGVLYSIADKSLIRYPLGSPSAEYAILPGTEVVGNSAFACDEWENFFFSEDEDGNYEGQLPALKSIVIPSSVKSVGWGTFDHAYYEKITVLASECEMSEAVGNYMYNKPVVRCLEGSSAQLWAKDEGFDCEVISGSDFQIAGVADSYIYTGEAITPALEVSRAGVSLTDKEYGVLYSDNVSGPTACILVYGKGAYAGYACETTFAINRSDESAEAGQDTAPAESPDTNSAPATPDASNAAAATDANSATAAATTVKAGKGASAATYKVTGSGKVTYMAVASKGKKSITVPNYVVINGKKYKVTKIADYAFKGSKATKITVGANVTSISAKTFAGAKKVKTITLGSSVAKVAAKAFKSNGALRTVVVKTKKISKKSALKNCLKGSKVTKINVKVGSKAQNKKYVKKYKKLFTKKTVGKKVTVK